jgi:uncharacterized membrane protein
VSYDSTQDDRLWAMLSYVLSLFFPVIAPVVVFFVKKDTSKFVGFHSLQALILQGGLAVLSIGLVILSTILGMLGPLALLAIPLWLAVWVLGLVAFVFTIIAAIKSYSGEWYEIPVVGKIARQQVGV